MSQIVKAVVDNQVHYHIKFVNYKQNINDSAYSRIKGMRVNHFKIMKHTMEALGMLELRLFNVFSHLSITVFPLIITIVMMWVNSLLFLFLYVEKDIST